MNQLRNIISTILSSVEMSESSLTGCPGVSKLDLGISRESLDQLDLSPFQAEIKYNKLLPYADRLDEEADKWFAEIKANLGKCIVSRDIYPGLYVWSSSTLFTYILLYGLRFTKDDHVVLVKLFYKLITVPGSHQTSVSPSFVKILILLLKKKEVLSPSDLELPWKPLYDSCLTMWNLMSSQKTMYKFPSDFKNIMKEVVEATKIYFPLNATQEILDELRPKLHPDNIKLNTYLTLLQWFLPVSLPVGQHNIGHELWFHEFMKYWEIQLREKSMHENKMMYIMAKLASNNIGYIDWNPYIPIMFNRFLYSMKMPVSYKKKGRKPGPEISSSLIAEWIASVLGDKSNAQIYLEKFLKTVETYFHPANTGRWSFKLHALFNNLAYHVSLRLYRERHKKETWENPIPESHKLTDANVDAFVTSMTPIALISVFNNLSSAGNYNALHHLASMRPNIIIPKVLEKLYPILEENTNERNKLISAFTCITSILRPLVQGSRYFDKEYAYSEGPTHVVNFLYAALSAINVNEPYNCIAAMNFIRTSLSMIPIVDCSNSKLEKTEEDQLVCEQTARFEDFILQFMDKIFSLIKSGTHISVRIDNNPTKINFDSFESMAAQALTNTFLVLVHQISDNHFARALNKLFTFVREETLETKISGPMVAIICNIFSLKNSELVLHSFVPYLTDRIFNYLKDHDITEEQLDNDLLYPILILRNVVDTQGKTILPYVDTLLTVIDKTIVSENQEINKLGCSILNNLLNSFCNIQIIGFENDTINDPEHPHWEDWGKGVDVDTAQLKWYVPVEQELVTAQKIFEKYFFPAINKIKNYIHSTNYLTRNELQATLRIIYNCLEGCDKILPLWEEEPINDEGYKNCGHKFIAITGVDYVITMPDGNNVKRFVVQVMTDFQNVILKSMEYDTECYDLVLKIWRNLSCIKIQYVQSSITNRKMVHAWKQTTKMTITGDKGETFRILEKRVDLQQNWREACYEFPITKTSKSIIVNLFQLSINKYSEISKGALQILQEMTECLPNAHNVLVPCVMEVLQSDIETYEDAYIGVLSLLQELNIIAPIKYDWQIILKLFPAMVLAKPTEKLEAIHKQDYILMQMKSEYRTTNVTWNLPESCIETALELWKVGLPPSEPQPNKSAIANGLAFAQELGRKNLQAYYSVLDKLIDAVLSGKLHWRHHYMATQMISMLAHPEHILPTKVGRYFLGALIHDSIDERKLAAKMVMQILYQLKRKHSKITINVPNQERVLESGIRADNEWLLYDPPNWPTTPEKWDNSQYLHDPSLGFYAWPKKLELYAPSAQQPSLDRTVRQMTEQEQEVDKFFSDPQNIAQLIKFFSLEEKKDSDKFSWQRSLMFEGLFRNHGNDHLAHFLPYLRDLVIDSCESSQRCAAEIICGLIRGSKHWPFDKTKDMWNHLVPIIKLILDNTSMETMNDWLSCFSRAATNRNPNRMYWMFELLKDSTLKGDRSKNTINEQTRLRIFMEVIRPQCCRMSRWTCQLLPEFLSYLYENPLKGVRDDLAPILTHLLSAYNFYQIKEERQEYMKIKELINPNQPLLQNLLDENQENGRKFLHTLCNIINQWKGSCVFDDVSFYDLYPILVQMENSETLYPELAEICHRPIALLATWRLLENIPIILKTIRKASRSESWSERVSTIQFLEVVLFYEMSQLLSNQMWIKEVQSIVLKMLEDERVEVREKAAKVLSGMLHCTLITDRQALLEKFVKMAKNKKHSKAKTSPDSSPSETTRLKHIGVLGMCAFIQAHPYDIPKDIPPIFEHLSLHLNEPEPILGTIRKTLSDFKRTHCDTTAGLQGLAEQLTPEQFELLQDLTVPPSYYS